MEVMPGFEDGRCGFFLRRDGVVWDFRSQEKLDGIEGKSLQRLLVFGEASHLWQLTKSAVERIALCSLLSDTWVFGRPVALPFHRLV
jgi:hypothetical protein